MRIILFIFGASLIISGVCVAMPVFAALKVNLDANDTVTMIVGMVMVCIALIWDLITTVSNN